MKILSIIIPVYNQYAFTKSALNDLSKLPNDHEIIVVDNGSTDQTKELESSTEIIYIKHPTNLGFAKACNTGFFHSQAKNIMFLNNDIRVKSNHSDWTKLLIEKCKDSICGPTMGQLDDNLNFVQEANKVLTGKSYMSGWCIASSYGIWERLDIAKPDCTPQIFSEEFGIAYFEDTDLSFRAKKLKIKLEVVDIPVVHFGRQTSKSLNTHMLYTKARSIFINKWQK